MLVYQRVYAIQRLVFRLQQSGSIGSLSWEALPFEAESGPPWEVNIRKDTPNLLNDFCETNQKYEEMIRHLCYPMLKDINTK